MVVVCSGWVAAGWCERQVFRLATLLAHGRRMALDPLFIGALFRRLDLIYDCQLRSQGRYDVVTYLDNSFLQMFVVELFPIILLTHPHRYLLYSVDLFSKAPCPRKA